MQQQPFSNIPPQVNDPAWLEDEQQSAPRPRKKIKPGGVILVLFVTLGLLLGVFLFIFSVRSVTVNGNTACPAAQILEASGISGSTNIFSLKEEEVRTSLHAASRYLALDSLEKVYPNRVILNVHDRRICACVQAAGVMYEMDETGMLLETRPDGSRNGTLPYISGLQSRYAAIGLTLEPTRKAQLTDYRKVISELSLQGMLAFIREINLSDTNAIYLYTREGDYSINLGDTANLRGKIGTVRAVVDQLRIMGEQGGILDASVLGEAVYTPEGI